MKTTIALLTAIYAGTFTPVTYGQKNPKRWKTTQVKIPGRQNVRCLHNASNPDPGGNDPMVGGQGLAKQRYTWAIDQCEIISKKVRTKFTHYFDHEKNKLVPFPESNQRYPSFSEDDRRQTDQKKKIFKVWKPDYRTCSLQIPGRSEEAIWYTICQEGCYPAGQKVKFDKGRYVDIAEAMKNNAKYVTIVDANSSLSAPKFTQIEVASYTADPHPADQELLIFTTESGKSITVTKNHYLVVGDGRVVEAQLIKSTDSLLNQFGKPEKITDITVDTNFHGKTYNVAPKSNDPLKNIVVAQGFLSGSHRYQSGTISSLDRKVMHNMIPSDILE